MRTPPLFATLCLWLLALLPIEADTPAANLPVVSIEATVPVTTEPGPTIRVIPGKLTLTRTGDTENPLTVHLAYGGQAQPDLDYRRLPEEVEFAAGESIVTLLVMAIDDDELEADEELEISLFAPPLRAEYQVHKENHRAVVVIKDSDHLDHPTVVSIKPSGPVAEETASPLRRLNLVGEVTISRTGATSRPQPAYLHISGSATPGTDYEALPLLVTIPTGSSSLRVPVRALYDQVPEGIESVIVEVSNCPPRNTLPPCYLFEIDPDCSSATVYIREDGLSQASVNLATPTNETRFAPGDEIALEAVAVDMEGFINRVEFFAGERSIGVSELFFLVAPDPGTPIPHRITWPEAPRGVHEVIAQAEIVDPRNGSSKVSSAPITIIVDDPPDNRLPQIAIVSPASGDHFTGGAPLEIIAEGSDPDGAIVMVEFFANGAKIGESRSSNFDDGIRGHAHRFSFHWGSPLPGRYELTARATDNEKGRQSSRPVDIVIDPRDLKPIVEVIARDAHASEPGENQRTNLATFDFHRSGPTTGELTISYRLGGQAENGIDYEELSGSALIPVGESSVMVTITPLQDGQREGPESVQVELVDSPDYHLGRNNRANAVISDGPLINPDRPRCIPLAGGLLHLCFPGRAGICFRVETSENMRDWETLFCLFSVDGTIHLVSEPVPGLRRRFFRISEEPNGFSEE